MILNEKYLSQGWGSTPVKNPKILNNIRCFEVFKLNIYKNKKVKIT
jgi:hypothetical protein